MKNIQIPYELFVSLLRYHLLEDDNCLNEIRQGLEQKLDSLVRHELYAKYKTAPTQEGIAGRTGKSQTGISGKTWSAGQLPLVVFP